MDNCWSVASPESVLLQQAPSPAHQRSTPPSCRPATQHAAATRGVVRLCKQKVWGVVAASRLSCLQRRAARMRCLSSNAAGRQLQHAPPRAASRAAPPRAASRAAPPPRRRALGARAIFIDRRQHLEAAWQRQQEREVLLQQGAVYGRVLEVADLEHLEHMLDSAGSSLVVVALYTRSCGACKALLAEFAELCAEAKAQQVRAVFAKHDLLNEFDHWSDVSVWHRVRVVPSLLFYDGGALVRKLTLHDLRRMGEATSSQVRATMAQDRQRLRDVFREMVFKTAPGARA